MVVVEEVMNAQTGTGFGRRVVQSGARSLTVVPDALVGVEADLTGRGELKEKVRAILMQRIDPVVANNMPRQRLRAEITLLVSAIATEEKAGLNEIEETALAADLTDDMVGLGPLEPLLQDETITDILVNGPCDIYVERHGKRRIASPQIRHAPHVSHVEPHI